MAREINLSLYKSSTSTIFTGRPQGGMVRDKLELDKFDTQSDQAVLIIPEDTTSFNPSFYLGLLFKSYDRLGVEGFDNKYSFEILSKDEETRKVLQNNLEDGRRYAINSLEPNTGLKALFSKRKR